MFKKYQPDTTQRTSCTLDNVVLNVGMYGATQKRRATLIKHCMQLNGKVDLIKVGTITEGPTGY